VIKQLIVDLAMIWIYSIVSVCLVSSISLVGLFALSLKKEFLNKVLLFMVAFSAGALLGDAFIHMLPETVNNRGFDLFVTFSILTGIITFFILEKFLRWRHCHDLSCHDHPKHLGMINMVGDAFHNFIDGLLIGASFLVSFPLGVATTVAVVLHEIPSEFGDFSVMLHSGYEVKKAIFYNFLSALTALVGVIVVLVIGERAASFPDFIIPFAVGNFVYIALSDLVPELHKEIGWKKSLVQLVSLAIGVLLMVLLLFVG
jgi:zinc and cadmium transporter